jgi:hypothetical protein
MIMAMQMLIPYALGGFALSFLSLTGCKPATDSPATRTVTKDVSVGAIPFTDDSQYLDFTPDYDPNGGWDDNFQASDIVLVLNDNKGNNNLPNVVNGSLYSESGQVVFTQEFYYDDQKIGTREITVVTFGNTFPAIINGNDPLQLNLSKAGVPVTE